MRKETELEGRADVYFGPRVEVGVSLGERGLTRPGHVTRPAALCYQGVNSVQPLAMPWVQSGPSKPSSQGPTRRSATE